MDTASLPQPSGPEDTTPSSSRSVCPSGKPSWMSRGSSPFLRPHKFPASATVGYLPAPEQDRRGNASSATWTSSSGDLGDQSDTDDVQDRSYFVEEYNRLAKKHGIRLLVSEDYDPLPLDISPPHKRNWFSRTFSRHTSATSNGSSKSAKRLVQRKRSISDLAMHIVHPVKKGSLQDEDLQSLVRLCGKSMLYLPSEYAPSSLILPTCFRATAQYLVQHAADARGVFRIPGSIRIVSALYDYYCAEHKTDDISRTIRCPNLPLHITAGIHDVASTFKKFLAGLPGGILGSLSLFDALVAIHSQLKGDPETNRTKESKLRARLISLAIGGLKSQYRRELICAVFGLLSLIGRNAEKAPREDDHGRPLPTGDLMGYSALSIIFGPLLVSDLLESYTMRIADPNSGLVLFPLTLPKPRKERRRSKAAEDEQRDTLIVDKVHVANSITEMLITHWREVVKHMKNIGVLKTSVNSERTRWLRPSASESFALKKPTEWNKISRPVSVTFDTRESHSPVPSSPTPNDRGHEGGSRGGTLEVKRQRPQKSARSMSGNRVTGKTSMPALSPTLEESPMIMSDPYLRRGYTNHLVTSSTLPVFGAINYIAAMREPRQQSQTPERRSTELPQSATTQNISESSIRLSGRHQQLLDEGTDNTESTSPPPFHIPHRQKGPVNVAPTMGDSKRQYKGSNKRTTAERVEAGRQENSRASLEVHGIPEQPEAKTLAPKKSTIKRVSGNSLVASSRPSASNAIRTKPVGSKAGSSESLAEAGFGHRNTENAIQARGLQQARTYQDGLGTPVDALASSGLSTVEDKTLAPTKSAQTSSRRATAFRRDNTDDSLSQPWESRGSAARPRESATLEGLAPSQRDNRSLHQLLTPSTKSNADSSPYKETHLLPRIGSAKTSKVEDWGGITEPSSDQETARKIPVKVTTPTKQTKGLWSLGIRTQGQGKAEDSPRQNTPSRMSRGKKRSTGQQVSGVESLMHVRGPRDWGFWLRGTGPSTTQERPETPPHVVSTSAKAVTGLSRVSVSHPTAANAAGHGVKAMAAMFESANKDSVFVPTPMQNVKSWGDTKLSGLVSQYTVNISPSVTPTKPIRSTRSISFQSSQPPQTAGPNDTVADDSLPGINVITPTRKSTIQPYPELAAQKTSPRRQTLASSGSESATSVISLSRSSGREGPSTRPEKSAGASLIQKEKQKELERSPSRTPTFEKEENKGLLNLGRMTPHQEEPDVARHINFSRPPSTAPSRKDTPSLEAVSKARVSASPGSHGGNSLLHSQIRSLQKQLDARTDEIKQRRRQLETKANLDLGTISEQLRQAKRECRMWRERAEAAEKRVAVFERFTAKIRKLKERSSEEESGATPLPVTARMMKVPKEEDPCLVIMEERANRSSQRDSSPHTEDEAVVQERIQKSFQRMDGVESSVEDNESYGSDEFEEVGERGRSPTRRSELPPAAAGVWRAAQELLEHEDMRNWLAGPL